MRQWFTIDALPIWAGILMLAIFTPLLVHSFRVNRWSGRINACCERNEALVGAYEVGRDRVWHESQRCYDSESRKQEWGAAAKCAQDYLDWDKAHPFPKTEDCNEPAP